MRRRNEERRKAHVRMRMQRERRRLRRRFSWDIFSDRNVARVINCIPVLRLNVRSQYGTSVYRTSYEYIAKPKYTLVDTVFERIWYRVYIRTIRMLYFTLYRTYGVLRLRCGRYFVIYNYTVSTILHRCAVYTYELEYLRVRAACVTRRKFRVRAGFFFPYTFDSI